MKTAVKTRDFIAHLVVYGLPEMDKKELRRFVTWLRTTADTLEQDSKEYSPRFIGRLMK